MMVHSVLALVWSAVEFGSSCFMRFSFYSLCLLVTSLFFTAACEQGKDNSI